MGGYDLFIFLLCFVFQITHVSVVHPCCFALYPKYISYVQSCHFCLYPVSISAIRYMLCLLVLLVQSSRFVYCCLSVSLVLFHHFTCCLIFITVMRYMPCFVVMFYILCFHAFNNHILYMLIDHMFHITMNMFDIMIYMINNLLYVIIIILIYGIKMTWKLPCYLTNPSYICDPITSVYMYLFPSYQRYICMPNVLYWIHICNSMCFDMLFS